MGLCCLSIISGLKAENVGWKIDIQHGSHKSNVVEVTSASEAFLEAVHRPRPGHRHRFVFRNVLKWKRGRDGQ